MVFSIPDVVPPSAMTDDAPDVVLRKQVRALRKREGWTQKQLAERAGLGQGLVSRIETGVIEGSRGPTLRKLAAAFRVPVDVLTADVPLPPPAPATSTIGLVPRALLAAWKANESFSLDDLEAVYLVLGELRERPEESDNEQQRDLMEVWLEAALALRRAGKRVTLGALAQQAVEHSNDALAALSRRREFVLGDASPEAIESVRKMLKDIDERNAIMRAKLDALEAQKPPAAPADEPAPGALPAAVEAPNYVDNPNHLGPGFVGGPGDFRGTLAPRTRRG